jgi:Tol biopolymer transport system component
MTPRVAFMMATTLLLIACSVGLVGQGGSAVNSGPSAAQMSSTSEALVEGVQATSVARFATPPPQQTPQIVPVTSLKLSGRMVFLDYAGPGDAMPSLVQMDLKTGRLTTLFHPAETAWVGGAATSPDGKQILVAYAPPPPAGQPMYGPTDLYVMPASDPTHLQPVLERTSERESFSDPSWSSDGKYVYYVHFTYTVNASGQGDSHYRVERIAFPAVVPEMVVDRAIWPRLSPDGTHLVYVAYDPAKQINDLLVADADGKNPVPLVAHGTFDSVDAPFFSPDGDTVVFSATGLGPPEALSPLERLLGVQVAFANGQPSDWWAVPASGGKPLRLTSVYQSGLNGSFSPDGQHIAFVCSAGTFVMNPDGSGLVQLLPSAGPGGLQWLP